MSAYNIVYNRDDSVIRQIFVGLLADLNEKIFYYQQISDDERVKVNVPFMYGIAGDEAYLQQFFFNDSVRDPDNKHAKTNYEKLPRGILNLTSMNIDSASLLNKYVYGTYNRLVNQEMKSFHSQFQMIPVIMGFDVEILVDSQLDTFKIAEALIKKLYKNNAFNIEAGHPNEATFRVACYYKLPEDYTQERPIEFAFDDDKRYKVTFSLESLAFIPSIDFKHEQFAGNRMFKIEHNTFPTSATTNITGSYNSKTDKIVTEEERVRKSRQDASFDKDMDKEN